MVYRVVYHYYEPTHRGASIRLAVRESQGTAAAESLTPHRAAPIQSGRSKREVYLTSWGKDTEYGLIKRREQSENRVALASQVAAAAASGQRVTILGSDREERELGQVAGMTGDDSAC